ncbi:TVP38/TMEM64 family protein [Caldalkalibacillus salinus]|uniref:TVP38/TMEM64 family protein n=1 Tax=Caldalkalibacillus salinus TaxID=2803787 RepID=UPI00192505DD|nr:TVP38/TMEM64 family protein [Caldalkalibacillus salinus]
MNKKIGFTLSYVLLGLMIYTYHESLLDWISSANLRHIPIIVVIATLTSSIPVVPYPVVGFVIGAAYGPLLGGILIWTGSTCASLVIFIFVRHVFRDWGDRYLEKDHIVGKITVLFERNAFLAIVFTRMIPIVPSIIINIYAALSHVKFGVYAVASAIGKVPSMLLFALIGDQAFSNPENILLTVIIYTTFLSIVLSAYHVWKKKIALGETS